MRSEEIARREAPIPGAYVAVFDAAHVAAPVIVRTRRAGDRIRPLGVPGHTSIKRLLITRRVARAARATQPLVVAAGEILWVPGCARSDHALVGAATERVLVIHAEHDPRVSG